MAKAPRSFRTLVLILKRREMGEADWLLGLLSPTHGKLEAIAKGARKPTSSKTGHVELFTLVDMLIAKGRELDIVTQAEMVAPFLGLREHLIRGAYANYVVELLDRFTYIGEDSQTGRLFGLLHDTLKRLEVDGDLRRVARFYELRLLDMVGFRPELQSCVMSHEPLLPEDQFFSYAEGGVISPEYADKVGSLIPLPMQTLKLLRHLQRSNYGQVARLRVPEDTHQDAERVMLGYLQHILEKKLQSVDFIRQLRKLR